MKKFTTETFIELATKKHGNKYDYSKVNYKSSHEFVEINCPNHGLFQQRAYTHLNGGECIHCGEIKKKAKLRTSLDDFIKKSSSIHNNKYDYQFVSFETLKDIIVIVCPSHGRFNQVAGIHLQGCGCKLCGRKAKKQRKPRDYKLLTETFISKAQKVHGDKYDYKLVVYAKANEKVKIICKKHGLFLQKAAGHFKNGCPECWKEERQTPFIDFIKKANDVHKSKYSYVNYKGVAKHVEIVCPEHGKFNQYGYIHLKGMGCPSCGRKKRADAVRYTAEEFQKMLSNKFEHITFYGNDFKNMDTKLKLYCCIHDEYFLSSPWNIIYSIKYGCPSCSDGGYSLSRTMSLEEFLEKAKQKHGEAYTYKNFTSSTNYVDITCEKHGSFRQKAHHHLYGRGCAACGRSTHKMQNLWLDTFDVKQREVRIEIENKTFIVDGFDPNTSTVYEFWGDFWHGNPDKFDQNTVNKIVGKTFGELYKATQEKISLLQREYNLVQIWETEWIKLNEQT